MEKAPRVAITALPSLTRNVLANWAGQLFFMASGFVLPRLIDEHIGKESLGVWDLGWTTVAYLRLLNAGIGSSVNRYVARHRSQADWDSLNRAASACAALFLCTGCAAAIITISLVVGLPLLLPDTFAGYLVESQWVVLFLGLSAALGMASAAYYGVITGHQRYDLVMYAETGAGMLFFVAAVMALVLGYGLRAMAVAFLLARVAESAANAFTAYRVCPELCLSLRRVTRAGLWEVTVFGGKVFIHQIARITLYQGNSLLIAWFVGPAALAVYSRAMGLVNYATKLLAEFGKVLAPSASSLQAANDDKALAKLILKGTRYSLLIALPLVLGLSILGGPLMRVWMGSDYADVPVLAILAIGHFGAFAQTGPFYLLQGMNRHGGPAVAMLIAAAVSILTSLVVLSVGNTGIVGVAVSVSLSVAAAYLFVTPTAIARAGGMSLRQYFLQTVPAAVLAVLPFAAWLTLIRVVFAPNDVMVVLVGAGGGSMVLLASYWRSAVPVSVKDRIRRIARFGGFKAASP